MKVPLYRISHTPVGGSAANVTTARSVRVNFGIEGKKDTFQFSVMDKNDDYTFGLNDNIKIYMNNSGDSEVLLIDGLVTDLSHGQGENSNKITVKGNNRLEILLNHQVRADFQTSDALSASDMIQNLLTAANQNQPTNRQITWDAGNDTVATIVEYFSEYRPVFQHIEKLSSNEYTKNGQYIFYLDNDNNTLIWKQRPTAVTGTIDYGTGLLSIKKTRDAKDVVNFMIVNAGQDENGDTIHTFQVNTSSIGLLGFRTKYEIRQEIAKFIILKHGDTYSNEEVRTATKNLAKEWARIVMEMYSDGRDKFTIAVPGSTGYTAGDWYEVSMPQAKYTTTNRKGVRLKEIEHNFSSSGWITTLYFEEELN